VPEVWEKHVDNRLLGSHGILRGGEAFETSLLSTVTSER